MSSHDGRETDSQADRSQDRLPLNRRNYLRVTGAAAVGSLATTGSVAANKGGNNRGNIGHTALPTNLRVEYEHEPNNLRPDEAPRFFWELSISRRSVKQTAYQIIVADSVSAVQNREGNVWDSDKVESRQSTGVEYGGPTLNPNTRYYWSVRVWDEDENTNRWSDISTFTMAIPSTSEYWDGEWIGTGEEHQLPGANWTNYTFEADFVIEGRNAGFIFRASGAENLYMWQINTKVQSVPILRPHVRKNGQWTVLETTSLKEVLDANIQGTHHICIEANDDKITTIIDGHQVDKRTDSTHDSGTVGFREYGDEHALFDNVRVITTDGDVLFTAFKQSNTANKFSGGTIVDGLLDLKGTGIVLPIQRSPLLRRVVNLKKKIESAHLHLSGLGFYNLYLNGERVGDRALDPGRTDYPKRSFYATYEVSDQLDKGSNALGIALGRGRLGEQHARVDLPWSSDPELLFQLDVRYTDGSSTSVVSDKQWLFAQGPTNDESLLRGRETYDARAEKPGWTTVDYDDSEWKSVSIVNGPNGTLVPQRVQPIKMMDTVEPVKLWNPKSNVYVYDLGQMIAGWPELTVKGPSGTTVNLTTAEKLDDNGTVHKINYDGGPYGRFAYTLNGNGSETWSPSFTYTGFRYIQVEGYPGEPNYDSIVGKVLHTAIDEDVGSDFKSSNDLLNQIHKNTQWAYLNNIFSIPTDTPVFEKLGWTADAQGTAETGIYNFDMARFWRKWLQDFRDSQFDNGDVPYVIPNDGVPFPGFGARNDPGWDAAYPSTVWRVYQYYGDKRVLKNHYENLKRYVRFVQRNAENGTIVRTGLGDWVTPNGDNVVPIVSTANYYRSATIISKIAKALGHKDDADEFDGLRGEIRTAFNQAFFDNSAAIYRQETGGPYRQTANVLPLAFGIVPDKHEQAVADNLAINITEEHDGHLDTGFHGVTHLLNVLTEHGHHDTAYTVANQTTYPSWGYWIENGITALLESWGLDARSRDHHFLGSIDEWFYKYIAGIHGPVEPGFKHIEIAPELVAEMDWAEATTDTVRGQIHSHWERTKTPGKSRTRDGLTLTVAIPGNATATLRIPTLGGDKVRVRESNKPIWNNGNHTRPNHPGVQSIKRDSDWIVVEVGSGDYDFELEQLGRARVDSTAPTAPSNLSSPTHDTSSVDLGWDAASDSGTGINHYNVYVGGAKDHEVPAGTTSTTVTTLSSGTSYDFQVTAVDGVGNKSSKSNTITVTTDTTTVTVVDDFEDGDIGEYGGDTVDFAVDTNMPVNSESYSLKLTMTGAEKKIASTSGLNAYPSAGDTIITNFQPGSDSDTFSLMFAADSAVADPNNRYDVNLNRKGGGLFLFKIDSGSVTKLDEGSINAANNDGHWLEMKVDWGSDGSISATVSDTENGETISMVSAKDSTFKSGGVGYRCARESSTAFAVDNVRLE